MITLLIPLIIACLIVTRIIGYMSIGKRNVAITQKQANFLWSLHKRDDSCESENLRLLKKRNGKIYGFKCQCGYKYLQKRPVSVERKKQNRVQDLDSAVIDSHPSVTLVHF